MLSMSAHAEGLIDIKPYVAVSETYDDNLFRVSGTDEALAMLGTDKMSDKTRRTEAGVDVDWKISRQHVLLSLNFNQNKFDRFSFLDNNGSSRRLAWDWTIGSHLGGELSISESKSMGGFTEINNPALNIHTDKRRSMSVNWDFHPDWRLHVQRDETEYANSQESFRTSDRTEVANEAAIQYATAAGSRIGLSARQVDTQYDQRDAFSAFLFGNGNQQRELGLNLTWLPSGKVRLNGRIAKVERTYEEFTKRNVKAWAGNVAADWQPTGKATISMAASRGIDAVDDLASTYVQNDTFSISPSWMVTAKLMLKARASYTQRSYQGDAGFLLQAQPQREDKIKSANLSVNYAPYEKVQMSVSWQKESRDSSTKGSAYDDSSLMASVQVNF